MQGFNFWRKVQGSEHWSLVQDKRKTLEFTISILIDVCLTDSLDCESSNVLYVATCLMCPNNVQYGSYATDMRRRMLQHKVFILSY